MAHKYLITGPIEELLKFHDYFDKPSPTCYYTDYNDPPVFKLSYNIELTEEDVVMSKLIFSSIEIEKLT